VAETSRPSVVASTSRPWIAGPWLDLAFFIGVPLFLVPLILARPGRPAVQELLLYLGAFGALGHHLPGMMRAYGDRELFRRYRWRFVLAPLFLGGVCVGFTLAGLGGVVLITFFWTTWHTLMQIFGFARIYHAKSAAPAATARRTARIEQLLCIGWIGAPLAFSDSRVGYVLELYYRCGGPLVPEAALELARRGWIAATLGISAVYLLDLLLSWRAGLRPSPVKLGFLAVSFGFWWFCMAAVDHLVVGIALFDVFHDVQYLALVWLFQRRRVEAGEGVTGFTRFLFRRSGALIGLYVGLVVAYGSIGYFSDALASERVRQVVLGLLAASALYHFYLDGFIWKVRERGTRASLGLAGGGEARLPGWTRHGAKWALFVVPLALAGWAEATSERAEAAWRDALAHAVPHSAEALTSLAAGLVDAGESERAAALCRQALALKPTHAEAHHNLGAALRTAGELEAAAASFEAALRLRLDYAAAHEQLAGVLLRLGRPDEAERHFHAAVASEPRDAGARANLGVLLYSRGLEAEAVTHLRAALERQPDHVGALSNLAWIQATSRDPALRDPRAALELAERLQRVTGGRVPQALYTLAAALAANRRYEDAVEAAERAFALAEPGLARQIEEHLGLFRSGRALGE
jgi:tetratricopeptide (TPR) repeat protein